MRVHYEILNQKGTPAFYSDTYTNRPTYGFAGRVFISTDTGQIFEDTGSAWSLIADAGVGGGTLGSVCANGNSTSAGIIITAGGLSSNSITNTGLTAGSVLFAGTGGLESQSNATFFWDNTNKRLGIGNASPGAPLDIHATGTNAHFNGTGTNNAYLQFQNAGTNKWRIGNTYSLGANTFDIYNNTLSAKAISINSTDNTTIFTYDLNTKSTLTTDGGIKLNITATIEPPAGYNAICGITNGILIVTNLAAGGGFLNFPTSSTPTYTFPNATGTLALTSNLSSYLPLTGGTLTGQLYINPTNTATTGLDVASDTIRFRSDNLEGFKRQLEIVMGSGTLVQLTAKGYGANYGTDLAFYTATTGGVNSSPAIYITGTNNRVGIKTGTPSYDLDVNGTGNFTGQLNANANIYISSTVPTLLFTNAAQSTTYGYLQGSSGLLNIVAGTSSDMNFSTNGSDRMRINSGGEVGIGRTSNNARLEVQGSTNTLAFYTFIAYNSSVNTLFGVRNDGLIQTGTQSNSPYNYNTTFSPRTAGLDAAGGFGYIVSTRESKGNIETLKTIDYLNRLNPVSFNYRKKNNDNTEFINEVYEDIYYGFIADEVEQVNKDLVFYDNLEDGTKKLAGVHYNSVIAILTKAIQELNEKLIRNNIN